MILVEAVGHAAFDSLREADYPFPTDVMPFTDAGFLKAIEKALALTRAHAATAPETLYQRLLAANARNLLPYDIAHQYAVHVSVSSNVGWLDFTHGLTFANAVRQTFTRYPDLWPQGLLQLACFLGWNGACVDSSADYRE